MSNYKKILVNSFILVLGVLVSGTSFSQEFASQVNFSGTTAIHKDSADFVGWAVSCVVERGYVNIADTSLYFMGSNKASFGSDSLAIGEANGIMDVVSLGDGGSAVLTFNPPITNGEGFDFAVFENALLVQNEPEMAFLELAFVEVSSDGENFYRFSATSNEPFLHQIGSFDYLNCNNFNNLAGKYPTFYGTPFDLEELAEYSDELNLNRITHVKIIDVIGSINEDYASHDNYGNIINDPYPTPFNTGGFDLDAVGVLNQAEISNTDKNIIIYPNPTSSSVKVQCGELKVKNINIFDATGRLIDNCQLSTDKYIFDFSGNEKGIYIIVISTEDAVYSDKIILTE
ncbi:MAG: T9SS type A sorting domain-containing protein [Bacteroidales bacterium]|nr:T9SS type A sorting domain-containing protein [Bacteroidales bacterium]